MASPSILHARRPVRVRGRRRALCAAVVALTGFAVAASAQQGLPVTLDFTPLGPPPASAPHGAAPMDRSFGHYPMSPFGIENTIRKSEGEAAQFRGNASIDDGPIAFVVSALHDWERQFPYDPWIAKDLGELAHFYGQVRTAQAREAARRTIQWLEHDYPQSPEGLAYASAVTPEDLGASQPAAVTAQPVAQTWSARARRPAATAGPASYPGGALPSYAHP